MAKKLGVIIKILLQVIEASGNNTTLIALMPLIVQQMATLHVLHSEKQSQVSLAV
jgi:hypothetical protein